MRSVHLALAVAVALGARPAEGISPRFFEAPIPWALPGYVPGDDAAASRWAQGAEAKALLALSRRGSWRASMDFRTGVPGSLRLTIPVGEHGADADAWRAALQAFAERHSAAFGLPRGVLTLEDRRLAILFDGRLVVADFVPAPSGIPVEGARLSVRVVAGNVVQIESGQLAPMSDLDPVAAVGAGEALATVLARLGASPDEASVVDAGSLRWLPVETPAGGLRLVLAWRVALRLPGSPAGWEARVDATSGALLGLRDDALSACPQPAPSTAGIVQGGVLPQFPWEVEDVRGMPNIHVELVTGRAAADLGGVFGWPGGAGSATFVSAPITVECDDCANPSSGLATLDEARVSIDFGTGVADTLGNGRSLAAERTSFFHGNRAHALARKWLRSSQVPENILITVNTRGGSCNGFYWIDRIELLPASPACPNTGEQPGVVQHEWGHALDDHVGGLGAWSEGMADHLAWITNRDPRIAAGFYTGSTVGLRNVDEAVTGVIAWPAPECAGGSHCLGEVYGQAAWHLRRELGRDPRFGEETSWHLAEALFFGSIPQAEQLDPLMPGNVYDAYANVLEAMFGDGDVLAGVPLASLLADAFGHHGLAPPIPFVDEAYPCGRPPSAPTLRAVVVPREPVTGRPEVVLSWDDPFTVPHRIFRSETGAAFSKLEMVALPPGFRTWTDRSTRLGSSYVYAVLPQLPSRCVSRMDDMLTVIVEELRIEIAAVTVDAAGDGILLPGETVDVVPTLRNVSSMMQTGVTALIEPGDPLVSLDVPLSQPGDLPPGLAADGTPWRLTLAAAAPCSSTFELPVQISSDQACSDDVLTLRSGRFGIDLAASVASIEDPQPLGNGSASAEPGETVQLVIELRGVGGDPAEVAMGVTGRLSSVDARLVVTEPDLAFGDVPNGSSRMSADTATLIVAGDVACGTELPLRLDLRGSNTCAVAFLDLLVAGPLTTTWSDPEGDEPVWQLSRTSTTGRWVRTDPLPVVVGGLMMPDDDATPDPGHFAWVTEARSEIPGLDDVDGGCSVLVGMIPSTGEPRPTLRYWRAFGYEGPPGGEPGDGLFVEAWEPPSGPRHLLEALTSNTPFAPVEFDLESVFGHGVGGLNVAFRACDAGGDSLVEAVVDEVQLLERPCSRPVAAHLVVRDWSVDDSVAGNGDGLLEPGESADIAVLLANEGDLEARDVDGWLSLVLWYPGLDVTIWDAAWPDIPPGTEAWSASRYRLSVASTHPCEMDPRLQHVVQYTSGGSPQYLEEYREIALGVPAPLPDEESLLWATFDVFPIGGWTSYPLRGADDWQLAIPQGIGGDPSHAHTLLTAWGTDLGAPEAGFVRDGVAATSSLSRLESPPLDFTRVSGARLRFHRWLDLGPGDVARVLVDDAVAWESPGRVSLRDAAWTLMDLDIAALADGRAPVRLAWELASDSVPDGGGWTLDTVAIAGHRVEGACACIAPPPSPLGGVLRVGRTGDDAMLDWSRTRSDAASFRVMRRESVRRLPAIGAWSIAYDGPRATGWSEPDGAFTGPLVFFEVRPVNDCGEE